MNDRAGDPRDPDPLLLPPREKPYVLRDVLEKKVYGCRDELVLSLGDSFLRFRVDTETDTLTGEFEARRFRSRKDYRSVRSAAPWEKHVGKECGWTWLAWNQQGYVDSVLLSFDGIEPNVLLQAMASSIDVFTISRVEGPRASRAGGNGKRNTKAKR